jgi:hypothetical protein
VQIVARVGIELPPRSSGPDDLGGIDVNGHDRALMRGDIVAKASCPTAALLSRPTEPRGMSVLSIAGRGSGYEPSTTGSPCGFARLAHASVRLQAQLQGLPQRRSGLGHRVRGPEPDQGRGRQLALLIRRTHLEEVLEGICRSLWSGFTIVHHQEVEFVEWRLHKAVYLHSITLTIDLPWKRSSRASAGTTRN